MLRPFVTDDCDALREVFADRYALHFYPQAADPDFARRWIAKNLNRYEADGFGLWAMCLRTTGALVGDCGITWQTLDHGNEIEIGYHLKAAFRGRGLVTEAARACLDHGFHTIACARIVSIVDPDNEASKAVAARVHHAHERALRRGEPRELYFTTRGQWEVGKS